jgi:hypothetical protein
MDSDWSPDSILEANILSEFFDGLRCHYAGGDGIEGHRATSPPAAHVVGWLDPAVILDADIPSGFFDIGNSHDEDRLQPAAQLDARVVEWLDSIIAEDGPVLLAPPAPAPDTLLPWYQAILSPIRPTKLLSRQRVFEPIDQFRAAAEASTGSR